jgi:FkbM family methyltransferase
VKRILPPISSIAYWIRFVADCRALSLGGSAKILTNKGIFAIRHALRRFATARSGPLSGWLNAPFHLRGLVTWSPASKAWYVLEDEGTSVAMTKSREEPEEWMLDVLLPGMTVIDVGAHQGRYAIQLSRHVGQTGLVVAVEPDPRNLALLNRNIELNGIQNVRSILAACWSGREPLQFLRGKTLDVSRVCQSSSENMELIGLPLDDLVDELALRRLDQVKIDVEGAELAVLDGGAETIRKFKPFLFVEFHQSLPILTDWLVAHGYQIAHHAKDSFAEDYGWIWAVPTADN